MRGRIVTAVALLATAATLCAGPARAAQVPTPVPAVGEGPQDADERGLWMQVEDAERRLKASNFLVRDAEINAYVRGVMCRTVGEAECARVRIYITRTPYFNASIAPNGMMQIWTGLLLRVRNEAQLAAVLGHEYAHFKERHSLQTFRSIKNKTNAMAWLSFVPFGALAQLGLLGSMFEFSRDMERAADKGSISALVAGKYDPMAASAIWSQLSAEYDATAAARKTKRRGEGGMFASHPPSLERMQALKAQAEAVPHADGRELGEERYRAAIARYWPDLIDDQIKLNDFGGTEFLLGQLASAGWNADLLFARGELYRTRAAVGDFERAADFYRQSLAGGGPVEAHRGLGMALLRAGQTVEGQSALKEYLRHRPEAKDHAMIKMLAGG
ncbi:M48 family metalloprotease [Sphingomonas sp.]|uniref:M48 family metalloprotease n=1 Tax=Sphingomonas sp. TaxID=28214 RepID=UPI003BAA037C